MSRIKAAANKAFRKPDIISDPLDADADFNEFASRRIRYRIYWSFFENAQYTESVVNAWIKTYKVQHGLYRYIRPIYGPAARVGEFWQTHLWGGALKELPLIPVDENNEPLLEAIARIFQWSNWEINKDIVSLYGAILGDVGIKVVEDVARRKVYLDVIHPGTIREVDLDPFGNVKGYIIEEERQDPTSNYDGTATYMEIVSRDGNNVIYQTLKNGHPFAWYGEEAEWSRPYGFVPLVMVQHNNVGLDWGFSEIQTGQSLFRELDDQASKLNDQIRKITDPIFLFAGVQKGSSSPTISETSLTGSAAVDRPQPGREEMNALYGPVGASAIPLVAPLDIAAVSANIQMLLDEVERRYPEVRDNIIAPAGEISGRALRLARQPIETKVLQRRPNYDNALVRALQMSVAIAGEGGYIPGFDLGSFGQGLLDFTIGERPIFAVDPMDDLDILAAKAAIVQALTAAGARIASAAIQAGFTEEEAAALAQVDITGVDR